MKFGRRKLMLAGAGTAAAALGAASYWWRPARQSDLATESLWLARFVRPDGRPLVMAELRGAPLIVNFWATWCPPCVKEMPEIDRFARQHPGQVGVVGLAVDNAAPVREFLARTPVSYPIGLAGFEGSDLSRRLGNERGGLPFTVFFDRSGSPVQRRLGETSFAELAGWLQSA